MLTAQVTNNNNKLTTYLFTPVLSPAVFHCPIWLLSEPTMLYKAHKRLIN